MTYSIVACDRASGAVGVAVQTSDFAVGAVVPRARPGVGAVATQAFGEPAYGWRVLDAIEQGADAAAALAAARSADPDAALRQVGVVSRAGSADAFTGALCIDHAGHHVGGGYAVQANMAASPAVWPAMAEAFECSGGPLAERLAAALRAGQAAGGDARGAMSASLLVVDATTTVADLRVDDHPEPLVELTRLLRSNDAFRAYIRARDALLAGQSAEALAEIERAVTIRPDDENIRFLRAGALLFNNRVAAAQSEIRALIARRPAWQTIIESLASKGLLALPPDLDVDSFLRP